MKVVVLDAITLGDSLDVGKLEQLGEVSIYEFTRETETLDRIKNAQIVITNKVVINREILEQCVDLQLICIAATGMNNIDLVAAKERNVVVKNVKSYSTVSVAQHTFAFILAIQNKILLNDKYVKSNEYANSPVFTDLRNEIFDLEGKVLGIIGLGEIGEKVANIAESFGMKVIYYSTSGKNMNTRFEKVNLKSLLTISDVISVHCSLNEKTANLLSYNELRLMKSNAILINTARGGIINHFDLVKILDEGKLKGVALDVFPQEPMDINDPIFNSNHSDKLIFSPHVAWSSKESRDKLFDRIVDNVKSFILK